MPIIERLEDYLDNKRPLVLTIGTFDGMHRGHLAVLRQAKALAEKIEGEVLVLTFRNHPSEVLRPDSPALLLCTLAHKIRLLQQAGFPRIALLPFTRRLSRHTAESFIENIRQYIPFLHLVLGYDATLGRNRQGDRMKMEDLAMEWGFKVHYAEEYRYEGKAVSSSRIREALRAGNLNLVEELFNRPYSIYAPVIREERGGDPVDFSTLYFDDTRLCLPPFGSYQVEVAIQGDQRLPGIAVLQESATIGEEGRVIVKVHVEKNSENWTGHFLEIMFPYN